MSEQELKDTAAFFVSPSGKKYIETEPVAFNEIVTASFRPGASSCPSTS